MPSVCSLFSGIGGIDLGFMRAGFDIVWVNEMDAAACRTYRHNFLNANLIEGDIRKFATSDIPDFDVLTAGFPCQPFSIAGLQNGFKDRDGTLCFEIPRIIDATSFIPADANHCVNVSKIMFWFKKITSFCELNLFYKDCII